MDDKDKDNLISILEKIPKPDAEFSDESYDWETGVDMSLQEMTTDVDRLQAYVQQLSLIIIDLQKDRKEDRRLLELVYKLVLADKGL